MKTIQIAGKYKVKVLADGDTEYERLDGASWEIHDLLGLTDALVMEVVKHREKEQAKRNAQKWLKESIQKGNLT